MVPRAILEMRLNLGRNFYCILNFYCGGLFRNVIFCKLRIGLHEKTCLFYEKFATWF